MIDIDITHINQYHCMFLFCELRKFGGIRFIPGSLAKIYILNIIRFGMSDHFLVVPGIGGCI